MKHPNAELNENILRKQRKVLEQKSLDCNNPNTKLSIVYIKLVIKEENIWEMIEKLKLEKNFDRPTSKNFLEDLQIKNRDNIEVDDFLDIINDKLQTQLENNPFYQYFLEEIGRKSEIIIQKLMNIKKKAHIPNDKDILVEIDWIINNVCSLDPKNRDFQQNNNLKSNLRSDLPYIDFEYLNQYSNQWDKDSNLKDLKIVEQSRNGKSLYIELNSPSKRINDPSSRNSLDNQINPLLMSSVIHNLSKLENYDYDIFELNDLVERQALSFISLEIFTNLNYFDDNILEENKFRSFIREITKGYHRNVTYHNDLHAADVLQTTYLLMMKGDVINKLKLNALDHFSLFISAIIHDYEHSGLNNTYHVNSKSKLAIRYNDKSVLENMHISQAFKIIQKDEFNILSLFKTQEYNLIRRRMIELVLATDMANHSKILSQFKSMIETFDIRNGKNIDKIIFPDNLSKTFENQQIILSAIIHSADISNPAKPNHIQKTWVDLIFIEFFKQGDLERNSKLPITLLCDRHSTNIDKSQIGFMKFVVFPTFESLFYVIPEVSPLLDYIRINLKKYEEIIY